MTSRQSVSCAKHAIAIGLAAALVAAAALAASAVSPAGAATRWANDASETGRQSDLVNRPGCWVETRNENRFPCDVAVRH